MTELAHILTLPILIPLFFGGILILINERHHHLKYALNQLGMLFILAVSLYLFYLTDQNNGNGQQLAYLSSNWASPFGIALVGDRLSAIMLVLTAVIANGALLFSFSRWSRVGVHFHSLFQLLLMGINGALLTGDLFNLFVFFEVMLAASYGLLLHGGNANRIRAGMQYIAINLVASFFFLIGIALVYAATGTLNLADIAHKVALLDETSRALFHTGTAVLGVAFLTKSAMWPLGFWLPSTYSASSPPVTAMLVLLTKIGIYVIIRLHFLIFGDTAGVSAGFGQTFLLTGGLVTLIFGIIGLVASQESMRIASYSAIISSGTLLALVGLGDAGLLSSALFYLLSSTVAVATFVLLTDLIGRIYTPADSVLALSFEAFTGEDPTKDSAGFIIPAAMAILGLSFAACALIIAGLPPLSGFLAKFTILHQLLDPTKVNLIRWVLAITLIVAGLGSIITLMRFGVRSFWTSHNSKPPVLKLTEVAPILLILGISITFVIFAGPLNQLLTRTANDVFSAPSYIENVLESQPIQRGGKG